jgi:homoserine O-acetyltransferase/O-succinyltransferase
VFGQEVADKGEQHEFVLSNFKTESGARLPEARIVYGTFGQLNVVHDNAILLPSHYMANFQGYGWLIGPGKCLNTSKLFLIATELFGNGRSSSPSNTPEPYHGPRFPIVTIRDNVRAVHSLLTDELHVTHLRAMIGFSIGAQQAFQWAVSYPDFADRSLPRRERPRPTETALCGWKDKLLQSQRTMPSKVATTPSNRRTELLHRGWYGLRGSTHRSGGGANFGAQTHRPVQHLTRFLTNSVGGFFHGADANNLIL